MWRILVLGLVTSVLLPSGVMAVACVAARVDFDDALDPSHEVGSRVVGLVEYRTVESAPYLGVSGARSVSAITRTWGESPADTSQRVDEVGCIESPLPRGANSYFVVLDGGSTLYVFPNDWGLGERLSDEAEGLAAARFGDPVISEVALGTRVRIATGLWLLPIIVAIGLLTISAVVDRRRESVSGSPQPMLAGVAIAVAVVLGAALSLPDPGWATVRFAAGFVALALLALWAGTRGVGTTTVLVAGTVMFAIGSGTLVGRQYASAAAAFGIALLVEGLTIHAAAHTLAAVRLGHVLVLVGSALAAGSLWAGDSLGGDNGPIAGAVVVAVAMAFVWCWWVERRRCSRSIHRLRNQSSPATDPSSTPIV